MNGVEKQPSLQVLLVPSPEASILLRWEPRHDAAGVSWLPHLFAWL